jgi:hypothetical protein
MGRLSNLNFAVVLVAVVLAALVQAEVTVLKIVQTIYDRSPKLRIKGTGFDADDHDITLDIAAPGQESLKADKDFLITKDEDGVILKLLSARRYLLFLIIKFLIPMYIPVLLYRNSYKQNNY